MQSNQPKSNWLATGIMVLSALILILETISWGAILFPPIGDALLQPIETPTVQAGYMLPLPLGLLNIIVGIMALVKRGAVQRKISIAALVVGLIGVTTGLFWFLILSGFLGQIY